MKVASPPPADYPLASIASKILVLRGQKVMLDVDLAGLYGVETRRLNEQVRRNLDRFPADFMFRVSAEEFAGLMSQSATSKAGRGGRRKLPLAFTEHGAIMAATVLNSPRAIDASVHVVRAFVRMREVLASNQELAAKLDQLEKKLSTHDQAITGILEAIRQLMQPPAGKDGRVSRLEITIRDLKWVRPTRLGWPTQPALRLHRAVRGNGSRSQVMAGAKFGEHVTNPLARRREEGRLHSIMRDCKT